MQRQTRANLIFLAVFLALSLPGAVILFKRKLDPSAPRLDQPDPVLSRLPFMTPPPTPPGIRWIVPDRTRQWLESLASQNGGKLVSAAAPGPEWEPVISTDHRLQVLMLADARICLLLWQSGLEPKPRLFSITVNGEQTDVTRVDAQQIPPEVRRELVMLGFTKPPRDVMLINAALPHPPEGGTKGFEDSVSLHYGGPPAAFSSSVQWVVR